MTADHQADPSPREGELYDSTGEFIGMECMDCGRPVHDWAAGDDEWNAVMGDLTGHIDADCFLRRAWLKEIHLHLVRYCRDGDGEPLTTRTSPQLSEGMVERAARAFTDKWAESIGGYPSDEQGRRIHPFGCVHAALTAALADQGNE